MLFNRELEFESSEPNLRKRFYYQADYHQISDDLKAEANRKQQYVEAVLSKNIDKYSKELLTPIIKQVSHAILDKQPPSYITVYRWIKKYENSGRDIRSLVPRYSLRGNHVSKLDPVVKKIIDSVIDEVYLTKNKTHIANIYHTVIAKIYHQNTTRESLGIEPLKLPHRSTIYRVIQLS